MVVAAGLSTAGVLPVFLLGGLVVSLRDDIAVDDRQLGTLVAAFFLTCALTSLPGGYLAERAGLRWAVTLASIGSGAALLLTAVLATTFWHLFAFLLLAGIGNGIAQPTSNVVLARGVRPARQGLAFGAKQAAIPAATMIAGGAVAILAGLVGWRVAYGGWALVAVAVVLLLPSEIGAAPVRRNGGRLREGDVSIGPMLLLAVAAGIGAAIGTSLASFFVTSAVSAGMSVGAAGSALTAASAVGVASRLIVGAVADRLTSGHLRLVIRLAAVGALGFVGLAIASSSPLLVAAAFLAFGAGWGWPGLFNFAVVRWNPNAPGAATAITQVGVFVGGVVGPFTFGAVSGRWGYPPAWAGAALLSLVGAGFLDLARRALAAERHDRGLARGRGVVHGEVVRYPN